MISFDDEEGVEAQPRRPSLRRNTNPRDVPVETRRLPRSKPSSPPNDGRDELLPVRQPKAARLNLMYVAVAVVSLIIICGAFVIYIKWDGRKGFEANAIVSYHIRKDGCLDLTPQEIEGLKHDKTWEQASKSMRYWMNNLTRMDAITSFHVGNPYCYILLRQADGSLEGIFNLKFVGYFKDYIISRNEKSLACMDKVKNVDRAQTVYVEYREESAGELVIRTFNNTQSFVLQSMGFYLKGMSTCDDSDLGMKTLDKFIKHQ